MWTRLQLGSKTIRILFLTEVDNDEGDCDWIGIRIIITIIIIMSMMIDTTITEDRTREL